MNKSSQELTNELTKLRSQLEDIRKSALALEKDGKSFDSAGKPVTTEAKNLLRSFQLTRDKIKAKEDMLSATTKLESLRSGDTLQIAANKAKLTETAQKAADKKAALESLGKAGTEEWNQANKVASQATDQLKKLADPANALNTAKELLPIPELPIQPDPELIKREALARAQKLRAEAEALLQQRKEEELNKIRSKVELASGILGKAIGVYLKLPIIDPKYIAYTAYKKAKKEISELKQKASKENLKKAKEAFTFPMKPPVKLELGELPEVTPPEIPEIPTTTAFTIPPASANNLQAQPNFTAPTAPVRTKFTFSLEGGGGTSFELTQILYDGRVLTITDWPIGRKFSPYYGYSANGKSYADGVESVRARIQDSILRGDFDRFVEAPF